MPTESRPLTRQLLRVVLGSSDVPDRDLLARFVASRDEDAFAEIVRPASAAVAEVTGFPYPLIPTARPLTPPVRSGGTLLPPPPAPVLPPATRPAPALPTPTTPVPPLVVPAEGLPPVESPSAPM